MKKKALIHSGCSEHFWEVAVFEYKKMNPGWMSPSHSVANVMYCKKCLAMKQLDEKFYKANMV